jgi:hypothetical protein
MPKGPRGQKRPADAIGCEFSVVKIGPEKIQDPIKILWGNTNSGRANSRAVALLAKEAHTVAEARWA